MHNLIRCLTVSHLVMLQFVLYGVLRKHKMPYSTQADTNPASN